MRTSFLFRPLIRALALATIAAALPTVAGAVSTFKVIHAFGMDKDGAGLWGSLAQDSAGHLYGTTSGGGAYGYGTVFELTPHVDGTWTESVLRSFRNNDPRGDDLNSTPTLDQAGNLYVTASSGGGRGKNGTVFELMHGSGGWSLEVLYRFKAGGGESATGGVIDRNGNLYGTGIELSQGSSGWKLTVLHKFPSYQGDGVDPYAVPIVDASSNLYGTTRRGGAYKAGTAYEILRTAKGWKEQLLHSFPALPNDGQVPGLGALVLDAEGNLYGTTVQGGRFACTDVGCGTIFKLTRNASGFWEETILYNFAGGSKGSGPGAGVVMDRLGNLYGTTIYGGSGCDCGVVYKLAPGKNGKWTYTVLHTFVGSDGAQPDANLILDEKGNLYGTTATGGPGGYGVAFEIMP